MSSTPVLLLPAGELAESPRRAQGRRGGGVPAHDLRAAHGHALHTVVFAGFSAEALAQRMSDCRYVQLVGALLVIMSASSICAATGEVAVRQRVRAVDAASAQIYRSLTFARRAKVVITATGVWRGAKTMALKAIVDEALALSKQGGHSVGPMACAVLCPAPAPPLFGGIDLNKDR